MKKAAPGGRKEQANERTRSKEGALHGHGTHGGP